MKLFYFLISFLFFSCVNETSDTSIHETQDNHSIIVVSNQIEEDITNDSLYVERAKINIQKFRFEEALKDLEKANLLDSTKGHTHYLIADVLLELAKQFKGNKESVHLSLNHFQFAILYGSDSSLSFQKGGEILLYLEKYEQSIELLLQSLSLDRNNFTTYNLLGYCYVELNDIENAISCFKQSIGIKSDDEEAYLQLGNLYYSKKDSTAIKYYKNAVSINPTNRIAYYNMAMVYEDLNDFSKSQDAYYKVLDLKMDDKLHIDALYNLGVMFQENLEDPKNAIDYYLELKRINPNHYLGLFQMAVCYQKLGDVMHAEQYFRDCLNINPEYIIAKERLEQLLSDNEKYK